MKVTIYPSMIDRNNPEASGKREVWGISNALDGTSTFHRVVIGTREEATSTLSWSDEHGGTEMINGIWNPLSGDMKASWLMEVLETLEKIAPQLTGPEPVTIEQTWRTWQPHQVRNADNAKRT